MQIYGCTQGIDNECITYEFQTKIEDRISNKYNNMNNKFIYLENVLVETNDPEYLEINGKNGTVIGLPEIDDKDRIYIIYFILTADDTWAVPEKYLETTGQCTEEDIIYPGRSKTNL